MQTYTHFVMTAVLARRAGRDMQRTEKRAALLGSVAPDTPLILLTAIFVAWDSAESRLAPNATQKESRVSYLFRHQFFNTWWVKLLHHLFHAPLLVIAYLLLGRWGQQRGYAWGASLYSFAAAALLHTGIDIPLHHNDGPLLLFPFDWQTRFYSPLSYWDPAHYGRQFALLEHLLLLGMLAWLLRDWLRR